MAAKYQLISDVERVEQLIEKYVENGRGKRYAEKRLQLDLLRLLETGVLGSELKTMCRKSYGAKGVLERIQSEITRDYALPKAIYDFWFLRTGESKALKRWKVKRRDFLMVKMLADSLGRQPGTFLDEVSPAETSWMAEVEREHVHVEVNLERQALEDMMLSALEAYRVPRRRKHTFTEIYGICLGTVREIKRGWKGRGDYYVYRVNVVRAATQIRARTSGSSAWPNERSLDAQVEAAEILFPYYEVVGDFHSHPYRTLRQIYRRKGWEYSVDDEAHNLGWVKRMHESFGHHPRVGFIIAIAKAGKVRRGKAYFLRRQFVIKTDLGSHHVFIAAYRILTDGTYSNKGIVLTCPQITGKLD
jgi:hypothetical protein